MTLPENFVSRSDLGWGNTAASYANISQGLVIHYDSGNLGLASKPHSACVQYWHNTRAFHRGPQRGWTDIGYSFFSCPHDYILEGRGLNRQQAAQPGGNATHYSVTLATGPNEEIPAAQINSVRRLRKWLIEDHDNHPRVLGHRDFISTSCPGDKAYALVKNGTFAQEPGSVMEVSDMFGLKKGDSGEAVKRLQLKLKRIGGEVAEALKYPGGPADGVDSDYGDAVAESVRLARKSVGSDAKAGYGDTMTAHAVDQVEEAYTRARFADLLAKAGGTGGGSGSLPTEFDATIKVK